MRYARFSGNEIAHITRLNFLLNQAMVTVEINSVVVFFGYSISDQAARYLETILSCSSDLHGEFRFTRRMRWRKGPTLKTHWRDGVTIKSYPAPFLDKPIVSFSNMHPQCVNVSVRYRIA